MKATMMKLACVVCLIVFSWALAPMEDALAQKEGGTLRFALTAEPNPIDTQNQFGDKNCDIVCQHVYENLVMVDKQMKVLPVSGHFVGDGARFQIVCFSPSKRGEIP